MNNPGFFQFGARPLGSAANQRAAEWLCGEAQHLGYAVRRLPFTCPYWEKAPSWAERGGKKVEVFAGPFSPAFDATAGVVCVETLAQLTAADCAGKLLVLHGQIAAAPLMPRNFPFYFPDEHKAIYEALDEQKPAAVLAVTGPHPSCGLDPCPLFDDANFRIPAAYASHAAARPLLAADGPLHLRIQSRTVERPGLQLVAGKKAAAPAGEKIVVVAHMDTAYETPGALDNAAGVEVLLRTMARLRDYAGPYDLEFVPFNGEDSGLVKGQLAYLEAYGSEMGSIRLVVNVDAPGSRGSKTHVSAYNFGEPQQAWLNANLGGTPDIERGPEWVEGDHSIFAFQGVPCLAVTSADLREGVMKISHTPRDTPDRVDPRLLDEAAAFIARLAQTLR